MPALPPVVAHPFAVALVTLELAAHFAFLHGPIGLTEGGTLLPELLLTAFVIGLVIWQYRRHRGRR
jgi:hypothetical protein